MTETNGKPTINAEQLHRMEQVVANIYSLRRELFQRFLDPRRNIADECGHPESPTDQTYQDLYDRDPIATRVVEVLPKESWQVHPEIYEEEEGDQATEFEDAWDNLLRDEDNHYQDEEGNTVYEYLQRADILSGVGQYGVILFGLDDGAELSQPAKKAKRLTYLRCFPQTLARITQWDADPKSERFGQPTLYQITFNDPRNQMGGIGVSMATQNVHWTRVQHIADNLGSSEVYGMPRMHQVLNRLLDLQKLYGGSAEMYWRGAFPGWSIEATGDADVDFSSIRDTFENYSNGLQRYLGLIGATAKSLAPQVVDPTSQINVQIEAICIKLGIPKRVFMGSERGELASSQDDAAWNDRLKYRQRNYITPRIIVPFVNRLISLGVLPQPKGFSCYWPDLSSQTDAEKANVATVKTQALSAYVSGGVEALIPPVEYLTRFLYMTEEEANAILDSAAKAMEDKEAEAMEKQQEKIEAGLMPDPTDPEQIKAKEEAKAAPFGKEAGDEVEKEETDEEA